jgi:hypothetical protein
MEFKEKNMRKGQEGTESVVVSPRGEVDGNIRKTQYFKNEM